MLDFNTGARQHLLVTDNQRTWTTPRAPTTRMRQSLNSVCGLTVIAVLLLDCSPSYVTDWKCTLENRYWLNTPIDVVAVRKSKLPGRHDAILVVNRQAGRWQEVASLALVSKTRKLCGAGGRQAS